ncbi:hypothetical protein QZH41_016229, partial [Actinostola sp. cb2023]
MQGVALPPLRSAASVTPVAPVLFPDLVLQPWQQKWASQIISSKFMGRWRSDAYKQYIQTPCDVIINSSKKTGMI